MKAKFSAVMVELFREVFCWLPLAHVLNRRVLVVHGGLFSKDHVTLDDIRAIDRYRCPVKPSASCKPFVNVAARTDQPPGVRRQSDQKRGYSEEPKRHLLGRRDVLFQMAAWDAYECISRWGRHVCMLVM